MVWIAFALMTAAAVLCILWPLMRPSAVAAGTAADIVIYKRQIADLDEDVVRGMLPAGDAAATRAELGRRLLQAVERTGGEDRPAAERTGTEDRPAAGSPARRGRAALGLSGRLARAVLAVAIVVVVPAVALPLYLKVGMPTYDDLPLAERPAPTGNILAMIQQVEAHLAGHPDDYRGYEIVAPIYMQMGRYADAARAYGEMIRIKGDAPAREADYGQALVMAADGVVTAEARAAFEAALKGDPTLPQARFFSGMAAEQDGEPEKARAIWTRLADEAPPGAPWLAAVRRRLAVLDGAAAAPAAPPSPADAAAPGAPPAGAPAGPMAAAIAALPADQRAAAIRGMVEALAARLARNGQDPDGWLRLVRAYTVLGDAGKARGALVDARRALGQDATALGRLDGLAHELGLEG